jgi:hypothetical protein
MSAQAEGTEDVSRMIVQPGEPYVSQIRHGLTRS